MLLDLSDDHELIRRTARDFATGEVAPIAEELDREKRFPYELVAKLGALGMMGIPFPERYGGAGRDTLAYALVVEELARVDSSVAITLCAHTSLGTQPIWRFGSEEQRERWLPRAVLRTAARRVRPDRAGSGLRRGQHQDARRAARRRMGDRRRQAVHHERRHRHLGARLDHRRHRRKRRAAQEISNIIVPNGTPGYEPGEPYRKMGWNASDTRPLAFEDCRVPEENLLGERGAGLRQFLEILDGGRIGVAAMGVGLAQGALDEALAYARERNAFGRPIASFQAIQAKLADMSTEIEAARLLVYKAALEKDAGRNFSLTAAQAKLKTGRLAVRCAEEAVQIHGGYGYIEEYPVCRFYRDAKILTIGEGTDEVQQMVIARALGA